MRAFGTVRESYFERCGQDPLELGEVATVGLMLSAAGRAGLTGLLEYPTRKLSKENGDDCHGRCDLWLLAPKNADEDGWAFEVKLARASPRASKNRIVRAFRAAWRDAGALYVTEASKRIACTVIFCDGKIPMNAAYFRTIDRLASQSHWAWRISHESELGSMYVLLKQRRRANSLRVGSSAPLTRQ